MTDWFKTQYIGRDVWAIDDHGRDITYLICGQERCLLIDTGWGIGDLPALTASLSPLPLIVVNTHGHPDHTFGNGQFPRVHVHHADAHMMGQGAPSIESRHWIANNILSDILPPGFEVEKWAASGTELVPIQDGHIFDLGQRTLEAIIVPGHTPGSICLLDRQARFLYAGDTIVRGATALYFDECLPLGQFRDNLQRLQGFDSEFDHLLPAHATDLCELSLPKSILDELVSGIASILDGKLVGRPERTAIGEGLRCDFGSCGVTYRPDRL